MKKIDLRSLIREEIRKTLNEYTVNNFSLKPDGYGKTMSLALFKKLMPKTAQTVKEATERLRSFEGGRMFAHSQVFYAKPNGNKPDRPLLYFGQSQYYLTGENVNVTFLLVKDITEAGLDWTNNRSKVKDLGWIYVDTNVFLNEIKTSYELIKQGS